MNHAHRALVCLAACCGVWGSSAHAASPAARQVYAPVWRTPVVQNGPCLFSSFMTPSDAERCTTWTRRETAGPALHRALGVVLVGGSDKMLHALDANTGKLLWKVSLPGALVATPTAPAGADAVYVGTDDGHVLRLDVTSGRIRWDVTLDAEVTEPITVDGDAALVVTGADTTYALRLDSGEPQWSFKHPLPRQITVRGQAKAVALETAPGERRVLVGHASGRLTMLARETGQAVQEVALSGDDAFGDLDADPIVVGDKVVVASHARGVFALRTSGLTEVWNWKEPGIVRLARGGNYMVVGAGAGKVVGLDAATGASLWRFTFAKGSPTRIVVQGGRVHVASDQGALYVLDLFTGRPLQYIGTGLGIAADVALDDDALFLTTTAGVVNAYSNDFHGLIQAKRKK